MRSSNPLAALYYNIIVAVIVLILMLQASLHCKAEIMVHRSHADSEQTTEEVESVEMEVELQDLPILRFTKQTRTSARWPRGHFSNR